MPVRFVQRYKTGFEVIIEAVEGEYLLSGRHLQSGAVFEGGGVQRDGVVSRSPVEQT